MTGKKNKDTSNTNQAAKKKGPPEFRHLPKDRAKKLKRDWIERKKIRAQWRHEQKKEGNTRRWSPEVAQDMEEKTRNETASLTEESDTAGTEDVVNNNDSMPLSSSKLKGGDNFSDNRKHEVPTNRAGATNLKASQMNRTSKGRVTDQTRRSKGHNRKELFTGKRRAVTMRERMGTLLEKVQKTMGKT